MRLPPPVENVAVQLVEKVGEAALQALLDALLGHRDPVSAVEKATVLAASKQAYRRPDLRNKPNTGT